MLVYRSQFLRGTFRDHNAVFKVVALVCGIGDAKILAYCQRAVLEEVIVCQLLTLLDFISNGYERCVCEESIRVEWIVIM